MRIFVTEGLLLAVLGVDHVVVVAADAVVVLFALDELVCVLDTSSCECMLVAFILFAFLFVHRETQLKFKYNLN